MKFGKSLSLADRLGARYAVILGEDEMAAGQFTVKRLADGEQKKAYGGGVDRLSYAARIAAASQRGSRVE